MALGWDLVRQISAALYLVIVVLLKVRTPSINVWIVTNGSQSTARLLTAKLILGQPVMQTKFHPVAILHRLPDPNLDHCYMDRLGSMTAIKRATWR